MSVPPLDAPTPAATPVVIAPAHGELQPIAGGNGQRYVVSRDGLYLEVRRPWIHIRVPVGGSAAHKTPYGQVEPRITLLCGKPPKAFMQRFLTEARAAVPLEHAAWITWHEKTGQWRYREVGNPKARSDRLHFDWPALEPGEWRVVDVHSHGQWPAGFSPEDDHDDRGAVSIALVVGNCDQPVASSARRICALGAFLGEPFFQLMEACDEALAA